MLGQAEQKRAIIQRPTYYNLKAARYRFSYAAKMKAKNTDSLLRKSV